MLRVDQVPAQIEQVLHSGTGANKSLGLPYRFESPHPPLSHPGALIPDKAGQAL